MGCAGTDVETGADARSMPPGPGVPDQGRPTPIDGAIVDPGLDGGVDSDAAPIGLNPDFERAEPVMARLTALQYRNTLVDIFGDDLPPIPVEIDTNPNLFYSIGATSTEVSDRGIEQYAEAAFAVTAHVFSNPARRDALLECVPARVDDECVSRVIQRVGRRLFRRPLSPQDLVRWQAVVRDTADGDVYRGLEIAIAGLLQSPHFLYRIELGEPDPDYPGRRLYTAWEMAGRLSFLLVNSAPDDQLLDAASRGELLDDESITAHARRLLADPRARDAVQDFFSQFLDLTRLDDVQRDPELYPGYTPSLVDAMRIELRLLVDDLVFRNPRDVRGLFFERRGYVNSELASLYEVSAEGATRSTFVPFEFPPTTPRAGMLTLGAFLTMNGHPTDTSPTLRVKYIRERVLCQAVPPPPGDIDLNLEPGPEDPPTLRERLAEHRRNPACAGCHAYIDPPGLVFEHYDSVGRYREETNGFPVDASGELDGVLLENGVELAESLRTNPLVGNCMVKQLYRHAQGRMDTTGEGPMVNALQDAFTASRHDFQSLILALVTSGGFRTVAVPEETGP